MTVPNDAQDGSTYSIDGTSSDDGESVDITGDSEITVSDGGSEDPNNGGSEDPDNGDSDDDPDSDYNLDGGPATVGPAPFTGYDGVEGNIVWQGQEVTINDLGLVNPDGDIQLRERVDSDSTRLASVISASGDSVTFDTEEREAGDYYLRADGIDLTIPDGDSAPTNTFEVAEQSLTAEFDESSVTDEGQNSDTDFEFESNRNNYPINVTTSSGDLSAEDLANIFVAGSSFDLATSNVNDDDDTISLEPVEDSDEFVVDFAQADIDTGEYEFVFEGTDSTAEDTDSITVNEADQNAEFTQGVTQDAAGDITGFNLTLEDTSDTYVQIGGEDSDFVDVLYIEVDDGDEPVQVDINTRLLGSSAGTDAVYDTSNTDTFQSEVHGEITDENLPSDDGSVQLYEDDGELADGSNNFEAYVEALGIADIGENQITRPPQSTDYEVTAAGSNSVDYVFDADPGGEANDELGSKVIELQQPEIGEVVTHTAPEEDADEDSEVDELLDSVTAREEIAVNDRLVVQVEATGLYGTMVAAPDDDRNLNTDFDRLSDGASSTVLHNIVDNSYDQIDFSIEAESATGNQDPLEVDLDSSDSDAYVVIDEDNGQFFVVVDTSSDDAFANGDAPDSDTDFTASIEYDADNDDNRFSWEDNNNAPFNPDNNADNYPYLLQGETLSNSADLTLSPRSIVYDNLNDDRVVEVAAGEDAEVSGTTNVAPGSDATIRVSSTDASSSFRQGNDVNISEDGSITTTYDLSDQEAGDEFELNYQVAGGSVGSADGIIVESVDTGDDGEETNETDDGMTDDGDTNETDDGMTDDGDTNETDDGSTDDGTPGFGAVVALVALIGAALLAVRRQN
ncbi:BGTF surface domain-containing protein [Halonotius roseus]|uniref:BGTF surface domain-containing protein n=1 Tax=Halonotius roseus TaxID=2511997 RepID=UPI001FE4B1EF|nr:BGTF surface domain-containing protein [Halonotius roseus]